MNSFIFPGQGSQYVGMLDQLRNFSIAEKYIEKAKNILGEEFIDVIDNGPEEMLTLTENAQPAIFLQSVISAEILKEMSILPEIVAGFSLGEFSALHFAGVMSFEDTLKLVRLRGIEMQKSIEPGKGTMAAIIGLQASDVEKICSEESGCGDVIVANYNCPGQVTISGIKEAVDFVMKKSLEIGAKKAVQLKVSAPFHTKYMRGASEKLREFLENVEIALPKVPVVSNVTAEPYPLDVEGIREYIVIQAVSPVRWEQSMKNIIELGIEDFYEVGPGKVLTGMMKRIDRKRKCEFTHNILNSIVEESLINA
ncbi:MAG: [acyl-carrier-protein] S-malonyltransferase [Kosmotogales bacterium]|nr:[acyl-carrier-protein] S-malonyltransferase [Kosmotogales bacterium]